MKTQDANIDSDLAQDIANFIIDDGDIALERIVGKSKSMNNLFYVGEDVIADATPWHPPANFNATLPEAQSFDISHHPDFADMGIEDIHVSDVDLSGLQ